MVAKGIQCKGRCDKAEHHRSVQIHCVRQSYLRGIEVFFNFYSFNLEFIIGVGPLEIQIPPSIVIFLSNPNVSVFDQPLIKGPIVSI